LQLNNEQGGSLLSEDAAGSKQKQVCKVNLQPKNEHGGSFLGEDVWGLRRNEFRRGDVEKVTDF